MIEKEIGIIIGIISRDSEGILVELENPDSEELTETWITWDDLVPSGKPNLLNDLVESELIDWINFYYYDR